MTIADMFTISFSAKYGDVDVYGDVTDFLIPAFCGPLLLTDAGKRHYKDVLNVPIEIRTIFGYESVVLDTGENEELEAKCRELFIDASGFCTEEEYDRYFILV